MKRFNSKHEKTREKEVMDSLQGVEHTSQLSSDVGQSGNTLAITWYGAGELLSIVKRAKFFTERLAKGVFVQYLRGLRNAHERGVVHGDGKLENVFLDEAFRVVVGDWGSASRFELETNPDGYISGCIGTPKTMAPEVRRNPEHYSGVRADVWSAMCVFFAMIVGHDPFGRNPQGVKNELLDLVRRDRMDEFWGYHDLYAKNPEGISPLAKAFIERAFVFRPELRASVADLLLDPWLADSLSMEEIGRQLQS